MNSGKLFLDLRPPHLRIFVVLGWPRKFLHRCLNQVMMSRSTALPQTILHFFLLNISDSCHHLPWPGLAAWAPPTLLSPLTLTSLWATDLHPRPRCHDMSPPEWILRNNNLRSLNSYRWREHRGGGELWVERCRDKYKHHKTHLALTSALIPTRHRPIRGWVGN